MKQKAIDDLKNEALVWLSPLNQNNGGRFTSRELNSISNAIVCAIMKYEELLNPNR